MAKLHCFFDCDNDNDNEVKSSPLFLVPALPD